jgi:Fe-S cluster assembly scaffold protein SufB
MRAHYIKLKEYTEIAVEEDAQYILGLPSRKENSHCVFNLIFNKEGVSAEIIGAYRLNTGEELNLTTVADHRVPNTSCLTKIKGVLLDGSKSDYTGKIAISKNAQQTNSFLEDNVLVLGEDVINNSSPLLEINANDVKASHGATTGRVSGEQIYYLTTRGLSREEAEKVIVEGFFTSLLNGIMDEKIKNKVKREISL